MLEHKIYFNFTVYFWSIFGCVIVFGDDANRTKKDHWKVRMWLCWYPTNSRIYWGEWKNESVQYI